MGIRFQRFVSLKFGASTYPLLVPGGVAWLENFVKLSRLTGVKVKGVKSATPRAFPSALLCGVFWICYNL